MIARRLLAEHRVRLPLILLAVTVFGFALVGVFAAADDATRASSVSGNAAIAFRLLGLDPLAAWVSLGQIHPIFLVPVGALRGVARRALGGRRARGRHAGADAGASGLAHLATSRRTSRCWFPAAC